RKKILDESRTEKVRFCFVNDFGKVRDNMIYFEGVINNIDRRYRETSSDFTREKLEKYMEEKNCSTCKGYRLKEEALAVLINGYNISQVTDYSIHEARDFFKSLEITEK